MQLVLEAEGLTNIWPSSLKYWEELEANTFISGVPYLEATNVPAYSLRASSVSDLSESNRKFPEVRRNLSELIT